MKEQVFNNIALGKILQLVKNDNYDKAFQWYEQYLTIYPKDYYGYIYYTDLLIKVGEFDEANKILEWIYSSSKNMNFYKIIKLKYLCCTGQYEEAYEFLETQNVDMEDIEDVYVFLKKQLKILTEEDMNINTYKIKQITNYSKELLLEHLQKHYEINNSNEYISIFNKDFPIEKIINQIQLPCSNRTYNSHIKSHYLFKYENCGITLEKKLIILMLWLSMMQMKY